MIGFVVPGASRPALRAEQQQTPAITRQSAPSPPRPVFSGNSAVSALNVLRQQTGQAAQQQAADQAGDQPKTIWSGVFTDDQAKRGRALYNKWCQSCHGAELSGGETAPPLVGSLFLTNWDGQTVGDLEERVRISMPQGDEGALSRQTVVDILAAVFAANEAQVGTSELPKEVEFLKQIKVTQTKAQ